MVIWVDENRFPQGGDFVLDISTDTHPVQSAPQTNAVSGKVYLSGPTLTDGFLFDLGIPETLSTFFYQAPLSANSLTSVYVFDSSVETTSFVYIVPDSKDTYIVSYTATPSADTYSRLAQFNPGTLPHLEDVFSDLYTFDVYTHQTYITKDDLRSIERESVTTALPESEQYTGNLVSTSYYTTISGEVDVCLGDGEPPTIVLHSPTISGAHLRTITQNIDFSLADPVGGVDLSSVRVDVTSLSTSGTLNIVQNGIDQTGGDVNVLGTSASYRFTYTPPFTWEYNEQVLVTISGTDLPPTVDGNPFFCGTSSVNTFIGDIPFQVLNFQDMPSSITALGDVDPPFLNTAVPASGTVNNSVFTSVSFDILDTLTGVNLTTLDVSIAGKQLITNGVPVTAEVSIEGTLNNYSVMYSPTESFVYGSVNQVEVSVSDLAFPTGNVLSTNYEFSCIPDSSLVISNFQPGVGTHVSPGSLDVVVDVTDTSFGVDAAQTFFVVNGTVTSGTQSVITDGLRLTYHPPNDFAYDLPMRVTVHATNSDPIATVVKEEFYSLFYGCRLLLQNDEDYRHNTDIDVFVRARNIGNLHKDLTTGYFFTTYTQPQVDMSASIQGVVPYVDLPTALIAQGPEHVYGETVSVEFSVEDFEGRILGPYFFTYTIETRPE